jgi:hypothetical protein
VANKAHRSGSGLLLRPGPCILFAVVKSAGWARQTDLGPGPSRRPPRSRLVVAPLPFRTSRESPNSCLGHFLLRRGEPVSARTGLQQQRRRNFLEPTTTARLFAGVDVSKDRLDVCLRWSEPESHESLIGEEV